MSRAKKMLQMVLPESNKYEENKNSYDFVEETDVWKDFKKWKEWKESLSSEAVRINTPNLNNEENNFGRTELRSPPFYEKRTCSSSTSIVVSSISSVPSQILYEAINNSSNSKYPESEISMGSRNDLTFNNNQSNNKEDSLIQQKNQGGTVYKLVDYTDSESINSKSFTDRESVLIVPVLPIQTYEDERNNLAKSNNRRENIEIQHLSITDQETNFIDNETVSIDNYEKNPEETNIIQNTEKEKPHPIRKKINRYILDDTDSESINSKSSTDRESVSKVPILPIQTYEDERNNLAKSNKRENIEIQHLSITGKETNFIDNETVNIDNYEKNPEETNIIQNTEKEKPHPISKKTNRYITNSEQNIEISRRKNMIWDKRDRCVYCNIDVTNFSRHLFRKHSNENSVKHILNEKKGSSTRKHLLNLLRKQGNVLLYSENIIRPVQRPTISDDETDLQYLPCIYCKGLYKKGSLNRHVKNCINNREKLSNVRYGSQGQTLLAFSESRRPFLNRLRLKTEVFDKMRADKISLVGKKDTIVCQYAEDYLKKHKRPHIAYLVSNKIRELGRLLIKLKDIYKINSMLESLKAEHFEKVVSCARMVAGYNESTKTFRAPSLALHFRTILLAICETATTLIIKKDPILPLSNHDDVLKDIKRFSRLVSHNWKFEMGSLALKDLTEKKSLHPQKLPVANDIILFNKHCYEIAEKAALDLRKNLLDRDAFQKLSETLLALTISLNRKRIGDVQYTKLESYKCPTNNQEDCFNILTESEKEITKHFKRIVTIGKGSKAVAILFPKKIQRYMDLMLEVRQKTHIVPHENPYLFALVDSSSKWIDGSNVLRKYAQTSGAKNPETITSSRLRKQIATVLQILNLTDIEMEQLACFMGHTKKTHEQFYRLPQEVFQTSKIAKLLSTLMKKSVSTEDQGKTIDEIDAEINEWQANENEGQGQDDNDNEGSSCLVNENITVSTTPTINKQSINKQTLSTIEREKANISHDITTNNNSSDEDSVCLETIQNHSRSNFKTIRTSVRTRGRWNSKQKSIMLKYFRNHIKNNISPKKQECLNFKEKYTDLFDQKTWLQIKVFVFNSYRNK